ncbi:MAG TPA: nuclear transport factor 2 family protein [Pyrinomonadaceae bacterium]|nr:nuclear transport factor 2 family protein [Pyrinomonadaceae bacterium]
MKLLSTIGSLVFSLVLLTSCGGPAANAPASNSAGNANTNASKPAAAAPTKEALLELDKKAHASWAAGDPKWFEENLSDKFVGYYNGVRNTKADEVKMISGSQCEVKESKLDEEQLIRINNDTYAIVYKSTYDGECTMDGQKMKIPSPTRSATIWVREGDKWKGAYHGDTPIIDPKDPPPAPSKAEPKKDEPAKTAEKKEDAPANASPGANTEALTKLHNGGWDAWRTRDAKWFNDTLTSDAAYVDAFGALHTGKDALVKLWTDTDKTACEGVTKTSFGDSFASALSPTVEVLTGKGSSDGKCGGRPNGPLYQTAVYVKEGDAWKLAFMFSSPLPSA